MTQVRESSASSTGRPLGLRRRPDLEAREHRYQGQTYWVIKDPIGLRYFRLKAEEYAILQMLDGQASLDDICREFAQRFAPQRMTPEQLQQFLGTLYRSGLVISARPGQGASLWDRRREQRRRALWAGLTNLLAIRFRGIDPNRFLGRLLPWLGWFFSWPAAVGVGGLALAALLLIGVQWPQFQARLPAFQEFFGASNWLYLAATLAVTKILHELGHGLACKRCGGECHEIGLLLLVFTPCLYCNVSDAWILPSKWQRAAIGAAGMYVEIFLASLATFFWWWSEPGLLNNLALQVMFVSSVSTVVFNGNPLLRYDGYYILSDLLEVPNLAQKGTAVLQRFLARVCLGMELPEAPFLPEGHLALFGLYTVAAFCYRLFVTLSILWFLYQVLEPYGLQALGQGLAGILLVSTLGAPLWRLAKFFSYPGRGQQVRRVRLALSLALLLLTVALACWAPLPQRVWCPLEIRTREASQVYAEVAGRLVRLHAEPGNQAAPGDSLAELENLDLQVSAVQLNGQLAEQREQLADLSRRRFDDAALAQERGRLHETIAGLEDQLRELERDLSRLTLLAPVTGTIIPASAKTGPTGESPVLREWTGSLLETRNLGAYVRPGALLCEIGDPSRLEAVLIVDQTDVDLVAVGQIVDFQLDAWPGVTWQGTVHEIARSDLEQVPRSLGVPSGGDLATRTDESGVSRPLHPSYQVRVAIDDPQHRLKLGCRGRAKIHTGSQTLVQLAWRTLARVFHFEL